MDDDQLREVIAESLQIPPSAVRDELSRAAAPQWDSLNHLRLITAVEQEFGVTLTMEEISSIQTVADLRRAIAGHRSA
jgi:acyl carrier protein